MSLSSLVVPMLLAVLAVYGTGKRVDVYNALTHGAEEGLTVLLRIVPALVGLLTAVSMFRASGAMEWFSQLFSPVLELLGIPAETGTAAFDPARIRQRRPGGGDRPAANLWAGQLCGTCGRRHAGQHGDHVLHHRRLLRLRGHFPHPVTRCPPPWWRI